ncbi:hypothetical protein [Mycolicibacterium peregrinum]|uniref:hypothetical protein n=1 Tax=Mycolicibacterium peregrinum TaxID=43304 RepID=UPI003AABDD9F
MNGLWNPEFWSNLGAPALALLVAVLFVVSLLREWIVLGRAHRAEVARLDARAEKDAESIATLSRAVTEGKATTTATEHIIASLREVMLKQASAGDG